MPLALAGGARCPKEGSWEQIVRRRSRSSSSSLDGMMMSFICSCSHAERSSGRVDETLVRKNAGRPLSPLAGMYVHQFRGRDVGAQALKKPILAVGNGFGAAGEKGFFASGLACALSRAWTHLARFAVGVCVCLSLLPLS